MLSNFKVTVEEHLYMEQASHYKVFSFENHVKLQELHISESLVN